MSFYVTKLQSVWSQVIGYWSVSDQSVSGQGSVVARIGSGTVIVECSLLILLYPGNQNKRRYIEKNVHCLSILSSIGLHTQLLLNHTMNFKKFYRMLRLLMQVRNSTRLGHWIPEHVLGMTWNNLPIKSMRCLNMSLLHVYYKLFLHDLIQFLGTFSINFST